MVKVGIVGVTSYTGEELIGILLKNEGVEICSLSARSVDKETALATLYPQFKQADLIYKPLDVDEILAKCDLVFLALPHTVSMTMAMDFLKNGKKVIDLSGDYRLSEEVYKKWYKADHVDVGNLKNAVYGLPELNREKIKTADLVSNPGCYPTSVILGLLPIIKEIPDNGINIVVDSKSGITGAGRKSATELISDGSMENFKCYKANEHRHIPEMDKILTSVAGKDIEVHFVPHLLPIKRGILSTIYVPHRGLASGKDIYALYEKWYRNEPFVRVKPFGELPEVKDVAYTNFCDIGITVSRGMLIIVSVIDNLLKGASGQAVQNMNIMCGLDECSGLI
ncbi:MAG: N-acetyl-gamma-glutamyl-phosphate reductase [Candidatus Omnitrophica bacterium]|nr:N-acetyl-gamma-glutamyl-phosphate reductase [Candidatus Omnitrophota bacterium]